jgi:ribosomal protein L29
MSKHAVTLQKMRDLPDDELVAQLADTRDALFRLHLGQHTNQVTSSALLQTKRRDIARIMTILTARKAGTEQQAQKQVEAAAAPAEEPKKAKAKKAKKS